MPEEHPLTGTLKKLYGHALTGWWAQGQTILWQNLRSLFDYAKGTDQERADLAMILNLRIYADLWLSSSDGNTERLTQIPDLPKEVNLNHFTRPDQALLTLRLGQVALLLGKHERALTCFRDAQDTFEFGNSVHDAAVAQMLHATALMNLDRYPDTLVLLYPALRAFIKAIGNRRLNVRYQPYWEHAHTLLALVHGHLGHPIRASQYAVNSDPRERTGPIWKPEFDRLDPVILAYIKPFGSK